MNEKYPTVEEDQARRENVRADNLRMRPPGYYWVRYDGEVVIAEHSCSGFWYLNYNIEVDEVLSDRLEPPK